MPSNGTEPARPQPSSRTKAAVAAANVRKPITRNRSADRALPRPRLSGIIADAHSRQATPQKRTPITDAGKTLLVPGPTGPKDIPTNLAAVIAVMTIPGLDVVASSYPTK